MRRHRRPDARYRTGAVGTGTPTLGITILIWREDEASNTLDLVVIDTRAINEVKSIEDRTGTLGLPDLISGRRIEVGRAYARSLIAYRGSHKIDLHLFLVTVFPV